MESGLLSMEVAKKVYEKKQKNNKLTSPVKAASVTKKIQSATVTKKTPSSAVSSTKNEDNSLQSIVFNWNEGNRVQSCI